MNVGVNRVGRAHLAQNVFHIGIASMDTVMNHLSANVWKGMLEKTAMQLRQLMAIGDIGVHGLNVQ